MKNLNPQELHDINGGGLIDTLIEIAATLLSALNSNGRPTLG